MASDDAPVPAGHPEAVNDNNAPNGSPRPDVLRDSKVEAALTQIAQAIGRHLARDALRGMRADNDNGPASGKDGDS